MIHGSVVGIFVLLSQEVTSQICEHYYEHYKKLSGDVTNLSPPPLPLVTFVNIFGTRYPGDVIFQ